MTREADSFSSPVDPSREYQVTKPDINGLSTFDLSGTDEVTLIDSEGSMTVSKEAAEIDRGKLKPRLGRRSLTDLVTSAHERWALEDDRSAGETNA